MVDFWVALFSLVLFMKVFMVTREVEIGFRTATFFPITMVENVVPQQVSLYMLFLGVGEDKLFKKFMKAVDFIHIKIILIILIQACHHAQRFLSILHFSSYLCTLYSYTTSKYTILWIFLFSTTQLYSLIHPPKPTSSWSSSLFIKEDDLPQED